MTSAPSVVSKAPVCGMAPHLIKGLPHRAGRARADEGVLQRRDQGWDALLTPTAVPPAIPVSSIDQNTTPAIFTRWVNFLDLLGMPNRFTAGGLPTSL
jgi:Asp-tRNA(Asn)/Glu-tRNA(Gln) amidotransferase A subunit family amidase